MRRSKGGRGEDEGEERQQWARKVSKGNLASDNARGEEVRASPEEEAKSVPDPHEEPHDIRLLLLVKLRDISVGTHLDGERL